MSIFHICTNGAHVTAIDDDDVKTMAESGTPLHTDEVLRVAKARFEKHKIDSSGLRLVKTVDLFEIQTQCLDDDVDNLGLTPDAFIEIGRSVLDSDTTSVDLDAMMTAYNIQTWTHLPADEALGHLSDDDTAPVRCHVPLDLRQMARSMAIENAAQAVILASEGTSDELMSALDTLKAALAKPVSQSEQLISHTIRSWEVGEGSDEDFTDDQRKPWRVDIDPSGDQPRIRVYPATDTAETTESGLDIWLEISEGRPALHLASGEMQEANCHIHLVDGKRIEATPSAGWLVAGQSTVYPNQKSAIFE